MTNELCGTSGMKHPCHRWSLRDRRAKAGDGDRVALRGAGTRSVWTVRSQAPHGNEEEEAVRATPSRNPSKTCQFRPFLGLTRIHVLRYTIRRRRTCVVPPRAAPYFGRSPGSFFLNSSYSPLPASRLARAHFLPNKHQPNKRVDPLLCSLRSLLLPPSLNFGFSALIPLYELQY